MLAKGTFVDAYTESGMATEWLITVIDRSVRSTLKGFTGELHYSYSTPKMQRKDKNYELNPWSETAFKSLASSQHLDGLKKAAINLPFLSDEKACIKLDKRLIKGELFLRVVAPNDTKIRSRNDIDGILTDINGFGLDKPVETLHKNNERCVKGLGSALPKNGFIAACLGASEKAMLARATKVIVFKERDMGYPDLELVFIDPKWITITNGSELGD